MYLETGVCAQCGKKLHDSAKFAPHNTSFPGYLPRHLDDLGIDIPLFCSQKCMDTLFDHYSRFMVDNNPYDSQMAKAQEKIDANYRREENQPYLQDDDERINRRYADTERSKHLFDEWRRISELRDQRYLDNYTQYKEACRTTNPATFCAIYANAKQAAIEANKPPPLPAPPTITDAMRFEHTHILGSSGSGKTTLIQHIVLGDLSDSNPPALIIVDPKGFMVQRFARMPFAARFVPDRLVIIDPTNDPAPPLNVFRQVGSRAAINYTVNNFDYLFAQSGSELTPMMRPVFRFCARLMFSIPDADILLLMDLLESRPNDPRFQPYIDSLTDIGAKRFFAKDFYGEGHRATREQVKRRFNDILSMPELLAAFTSPSPTLDMGTCLQQRKIVLVNTGRNSLGPKESQLLGRYIISLTLSAAFARGINGPPAFLFIDEFQDFADEQQTAEQLRLAREYNLGIVCAHQNMYCAELNDNLRNAISTNTTIKYCSKPEAMDKSYMARDFSCDTDFLDKHVKSATHANFACLVKGYPPFSVQVPFGNINPQMQMSDVADSTGVTTDTTTRCPRQTISAEAPHR